MNSACGSHWYRTGPGVKFTIQVSWPVRETSVAQLEIGTHETVLDSEVRLSGRSRWKLWNAELSSISRR